jgi:hypothetical protein
MNTRLIRVERVVAALLVLAGGIIHLKLYFDGYRDVPNANLGRSFLLNFAASAVVAILLVVWRSPLALVAGLVLVDATLIGFGLSRTSQGIFGFTESGFQPSPEAVLSLVVEIAAAVILIVLLAVEWRGEVSAVPMSGQTGVTV